MKVFRKLLENHQFSSYERNCIKACQLTQFRFWWFLCRRSSRSSCCCSWNSSSFSTKMLNLIEIIRV